MIEYIIRRIVLMVPTLIGISLVVFVLVNMVPGGPVEQAIQRMRGAGSGGESGGLSGGSSSGMTEESLQQLREYYGFDKPIHIRYFTWLRQIVVFDFGQSYNYRRPVWELIKERVPISLGFGGTALVFSYLVCVPLGVYKAIHHRTMRDSVTSILVFAGYSIPEFALGMLLLVLFGGGSFWNFFPLGGVTSYNFAELSAWGKFLDIAHHAVLPLICYMVSSFAVLTVLMKNSVLENINSDYVRTALAKGLSFRWTVYRHALRNSLIPIATGLGAIITVFVSGSLLIELVFNIHGMGLLNYDAIVQRDYPVTLGIIMIASLLTLVGRLLSDIIYVLVDPRISFE